MSKHVLDNLIVRVTYDHMQIGKECNNRKCALAIAMKENLAACGHADADVVVGNSIMQIKLTEKQDGYYCLPMTKAVQVWIKCWDRQETVGEMRVKFRRAQDAFGQTWEVFVIGETGLEVTE